MGRLCIVVAGDDEGKRTRTSEFGDEARKRAGKGDRLSIDDRRMALEEYKGGWLRLEVKVEVKLRGVTTREEGGNRVRGELGFSCRDADALGGG